MPPPVLIALPLQLGGRDRPLRPQVEAEEANRSRPFQAGSGDYNPGKDGRVVIYSGDDERFDYIYRFVDFVAGQGEEGVAEVIQPAIACDAARCCTPRPPLTSRIGCRSRASR